jgi:hypothetical protein
MLTARIFVRLDNPGRMGDPPMVAIRLALLACLLMLQPALANAQNSYGGGYEQDTVIADGPIVYGTNLSDADRSKAWKRFFLQMAEAVVRQQGQDALEPMLMRRCEPGKTFCTMILAADFVGIGGIKEPRKILLLIATDVQDQDKQLQRMVCTRPAKGVQICRDWDTGKLITDPNER